MRLSGMDLRLLRISQWPPGAEEPPLQPGDHFAVHLTPGQVAERTRSCDLLIAPSSSQEAFGLPVLESMASGVPVITSNVPCFGYTQNAAVRLDPMDVEGMAKAARAVLESTTRWHFMRRRGLRVATAYQPGRIADLADSALRWAIAG